MCAHFSHFVITTYAPVRAFSPEPATFTGGTWLARLCSRTVMDSSKAYLHANSDSGSAPGKCLKDQKTKTPAALIS